MTVNRISTFFKFLYEPATLAKPLPEKVLLVGASVLFGIVTAGLIHAAFSLPYLRGRIKKKL